MNLVRVGALSVALALACGGSADERPSRVPEYVIEEPPPVEPVSAKECTDPIRQLKADGFEVKVRRKAYAIEGQSVDALRASINRNKPREFDAYATWYVTWKTEGPRCAPQIGLQLEFEHPEWKKRKGAPQDVIDRWKAYTRALKCHEYGHAEFGARAARAVHAEFERLGCKADHDKVFQRIIADFAAQDDVYDETTRHGATQGATFP